MTTLLADLKLELGEGLHWDSSSGRLWFVDISNSKLFSFMLESQEVTEFKFHKNVCWVISIRNSNNLLIGLRNEIVIFDPIEKEIKKTVQVFDGFSDTVRLNDAKADADGNIWAGTMNEKFPESFEGKLYLITPSGITVKDNNYGIANGPAISKNGKIIYHTDSFLKCINILKRNSDNSLEKYAEIKSFREEESPDGMSLDSEGFLWVAIWGGSKVKRINTQTKEEYNFKIPSKFVTNICFAGKNLDRLIVSTAINSMGSSSDSNLNIGGIYEIKDHGCKGIPTLKANNRFADE